MKIINEEDYGREIYDMEKRREMIGIGEDMVKIEYEEKVDMEKKEKIEEEERRMLEIEEKGRYDGGLMNLKDEVKKEVEMEKEELMREGKI